MIGAGPDLMRHILEKEFVGMHGEWEITVRYYSEKSDGKGGDIRQ